MTAKTDKPKPERETVRVNVPETGAKRLAEIRERHTEADDEDVYIHWSESDVENFAIHAHRDRAFLLEQLTAAQERIAELEEASRTRKEYDLRCDKCGAPHWFDTSIPSEIWNQIAEPHEILCLLCIDNLMSERGLSCECQFYFVGKAVYSELYADDLQKRITNQTAALNKLQRKYNSMKGGLIKERDELRAALESAPEPEVCDVRAEALDMFYEEWYTDPRKEALGGD